MERLVLGDPDFLVPGERDLLSDGELDRLETGEIDFLEIGDKDFLDFGDSEVLDKLEDLFILTVDSAVMSRIVPTLVFITADTAESFFRFTGVVFSMFSEVET